MYRYDSFDREFVRSRVAQFRQQVERRIEGSLTEEEFKPLRLMNGLYLQLHAYMLRVAIPYGTLDSRQMRQLAHIAERWDKGYGHFTTRQNIQFNWPRLKDVPDILDALADVEMHAIQTSGNCVRNVTADHFAGAAADEIADPRPTAEVLRQWSTDHPEFAFLPRKFKIAVSGSPIDRAVTRAHDIGLRMIRNGAGETGYEVVVGGGLGRTPVIGPVIRDFLPEADLLPYVESILQVYNAIGRRDNKYKARIKITVNEHGLETFRERVEQRFLIQRKAFRGVHQALLKAHQRDVRGTSVRRGVDRDIRGGAHARPGFRSFADTNLYPHRNPAYAIVTISLKAHGATPGDATAEQMRVIAGLAELYGHDEIRISHEQNCILPHVHKRDVPAVHAALREAELATANVGLASDIIACPGLDYCNLATARSIPIAQGIATRMKERGGRAPDRRSQDQDIRLHQRLRAPPRRAHRHSRSRPAPASRTTRSPSAATERKRPRSVNRAGPGFAANDVVPAVERLIDAYLDLRSNEDEAFLATYRRVGMQPFKAVLYPDAAPHRRTLAVGGLNSGILVRDTGFHDDDWRGEFVRWSGDGDHTALPDGGCARYREHRAGRRLRDPLRAHSPHSHFIPVAPGRPRFHAGSPPATAGLPGAGCARQATSSQINTPWPGRSGFDEVEIDPALARRQPEEQWLFRADWRTHDYQERSGPAPL